MKELRSHRNRPGVAVEWVLFCSCSLDTLTNQWPEQSGLANFYKYSFDDTSLFFCFFLDWRNIEHFALDINVHLLPLPTLGPKLDWNLCLVLCFRKWTIQRYILFLFSDEKQLWGIFLSCLWFISLDPQLCLRLSFGCTQTNEHDSMWDQA